MDTLAWTASKPPFAIQHGAQHAERVFHARCAVMSVTYVTHMAEMQEERARQGIEVLFPSDQAAFHLTYQTQNGRRQTTVVRGHHVSVIPAHRPYAVHCEQPCDLLVIVLDQAFFDDKAGAALGAEAHELVERYASVDPFLREVGNTLRSEFHMHRTPSEGYLESLAGVIAIHLINNYRGYPATTHSYGLAADKLIRVEAFIKEHFAEAIRVQHLAATIHMSPYHFARMFKRATGQPPHLYITVHRMERAKELLRDSSLPLVGVAASVGFQTQGYFTRVFHKYTGLTPRIFRLNCRSARASRVSGAVYGGSLCDSAEMFSRR
jgi:AraC family transcriptional regulator